MDEKLATFKIDRSQWDAFVRAAKDRNTSASALLKGFVDAYLRGDIDQNLASGIATDSDIEARIEILIDQRLRGIEARLGKLSA